MYETWHEASTSGYYSRKLKRNSKGVLPLLHSRQRNVLYLTTRFYCISRQVSCFNSRQPSLQFTTTSITIYVMLYVMLCYVMLCYAMLCYVMLCHVMSCHVMSCHVMSCYVMLCYVMLCYVIGRDVVLCCAVMMCCSVLCCVVLCCVVLYCIVLNRISSCKLQHVRSCCIVYSV